MTASERLQQLSSLAGVTAAVMLLSIGSGATAGQALADYSGLSSATAAVHLLTDVSIPDAQTTDTHDGGGYYVQKEKRKPWRKPEGDVRQWVIDAYAALSKSPEPVYQAAAVAVVAKYVKPAGEDRAVPLPRQIDWPALLADVQAVDSLLRTYEMLIAIRDEDEDDDFLLLMGY